MRSFLLLATILLALAGVMAHAQARVQSKTRCWEPDIEFPVPCDPDGD